MLTGVRRGGMMRVVCTITKVVVFKSECFVTLRSAGRHTMLRNVYVWAAGLFVIGMGLGIVFETNRTAPLWIAPVGGLMVLVAILMVFYSIVRAIGRLFSGRSTAKAEAQSKAKTEAKVKAEEAAKAVAEAKAEESMSNPYIVEKRDLKREIELLDLEIEKREKERKLEKLKDTE